MNRLEIIRGRASVASPLVKQAIRFGRRLRQHGIWTYSFPSFVEDGRSAIKVYVGSRAVNIFDDGSVTRGLLRVDGHIDGRAVVAQCRRMHAVYLIIAAESRRAGRKRAAFDHLKFAIEERIHERKI